MLENINNEFKEFENTFIESVEDFIEISCIKQETTLFDSKVCGNPYYPKDLEYPRGQNNKPLVLLAQINFSDVPNIKNYPNKGILQFYICGNDDLLGVDFDNGTSQKNFKIVYHEEVIFNESKLVTDFSFVEGFKEFYPEPKESKMTFNSKKETVTVGDYRFKKYFGQEAFDFCERFDDEEIAEEFFETFSSNGHKIGGYAYFTQEDPRLYKYREHELLLFQLDTDMGIDLMWGDSGIANFFIKKEDLLKLNFEDVLYNWDCC